MADPAAPKLAVPYVLRGAFLMSLLGAHTMAPILHKSGDRAWRLETAMTGIEFVSLVLILLLHPRLIPVSNNIKLWGLTSIS